jgi:hypothetical protein
MSTKTAARTLALILFLLGLCPYSFSSTTLNFPRISYDSKTFTGMAFVNPNSTQADITLSAFGTDGTLIHRTGFTNPVTLTVPAGQQIARVLTDPDMFGSLQADQIAWVQATRAMYRDVEELFGFTGDETILGWLKVEATSASLNGFISYGLEKSGATGGSLAAVTSEATALTHGLFSHIATASGYFTGIALLTPGQIANPYRVAAFKVDGSERSDRRPTGAGQTAGHPCIQTRVHACPDAGTATPGRAGRTSGRPCRRCGMRSFGARGQPGCPPRTQIKSGKPRSAARPWAVLPSSLRAPGSAPWARR